MSAGVVLPRHYSKRIIHIYMYDGITLLYIAYPLYLPPKRAFQLVANFESLPRNIVPTQDLARSLNIFSLPLLASIFTAIYGYKILKLMTPVSVYN